MYPYILCQNRFRFLFSLFFKFINKIIRFNLLLLDNLYFSIKSILQMLGNLFQMLNNIHLILKNIFLMLGIDSPRLYIRSKCVTCLSYIDKRSIIFMFSFSFLFIFLYKLINFQIFTSHNFVSVRVQTLVSFTLCGIT